jgi:hypothetical protein
MRGIGVWPTAISSVCMPVVSVAVRFAWVPPGVVLGVLVNHQMVTAIIVQVVIMNSNKPNCQWSSMSPCLCI